MKILIVNKFLKPNGGSETYIIQIGNCLKKQGHQVEYFGMDDSQRTLSNSAGLYTANMDFHTNKWKKILYPFSIIYSSEAKRKLIEVCELFQPDIVHLNNFNFQLTPSVIYAVRSYGNRIGRHIPIIYTAHDFQLVCPNHMMHSPLDDSNCELCIGGNYVNCIQKKCLHSSFIKSVLAAMEAYLYHFLKTYRYIDLIICPSRFLENKLNKVKSFRGKTVTLHNFIDIPDYFIDTPDDKRKKDYVLYFGRFSREKGVKTLIQACRELPDIPFVFAGSGPFEALVNETENIKNMGFISGNNLLDCIQQAKFSISPSECYENCPFSVIESQVYGTPVIGARIGGIPELIQEKTTGILFESGNLKDLKEKIHLLWDSTDLVPKWSENCKKLEFDTLEIYCKKLIKLYESCITS